MTKNPKQAPPDVIFFEVKDSTNKQWCISETIQVLYDKGHSVMICTPSLTAAQYVDDLLWRMPMDSFIPHGISHIPTLEKIVISTHSKNLNKAEILFNLGPSIVSEGYVTIYEFMDLTHPDKTQVSIKKKELYEKQSCPVTIQTSVSGS